MPPVNQYSTNSSDGISLDGDKNTHVSIAGPLTAFGELLTATRIPATQIDAVYGIREGIDVESSVDSLGSGAVTAEAATTGMEFKLATGTNAAGTAILWSHRAVRYRPGEGFFFRMTARAAAPVLNSTQRWGAMNSGNELTFGYNTNGKFGILHRRGGRRHIVRLTITNPAGGAETATITLNGAAFNVSLTAGTATQNTQQIVSNSFTGWDDYQNNGFVSFVATRTGARAGTYSFTSTGTATGTFSTIHTGQAATDTWYYQEDWNGDPLNSAANSAFVLDPTKGNVYQIQAAYLGYGTIKFCIQEPTKGRFVVVHRIEYPNSGSSPTLDYPILRAGWLSANVGNTSDIVLRGASAAGFVEGPVSSLRDSYATQHSKTGIGTTSTSILTIRNNPIFNNRWNASEARPITVHVAIEGTKPGEVEVVRNATLAGTPAWNYVNSTVSFMEVDTAGTTITNGVKVDGASIGKSSSISLRLAENNLRIEPGETLTIAAKATSGTIDVSVTLVWDEE